MKAAKANKEAWAKWNAMGITNLCYAKAKCGTDTLGGLASIQCGKETKVDTCVLPVKGAMHIAATFLTGASIIFSMS